MWWEQMLFSPNSQTPGTGKIPQTQLIIIQQAGLIWAIYLQGPIQSKVEEANISFIKIEINCSQIWPNFF